MCVLRVIMTRLKPDWAVKEPVSIPSLCSLVEFGRRNLKKFGRVPPEPGRGLSRFRASLG